MPTNYKLEPVDFLYQRQLYEAGGITKWYWDKKDRKIISKIPENSKLILDFGCGEGILMEKLVRRFPESKIIGVDVIPDNISICQRNNLDVFLTEVNKPIHLESNSIDVILLIEVIEHLDNPMFVISEISRLLKKDGTLVILFPNDFVFALTRLLLLKIKEFKHDPGHIYQYSFEKVKNLLETDFVLSYEIGIPFIFFPISLHGLMVFKKI